MTWRLVLGVVVLQRWSLLNTLLMLALVSRANGMPAWMGGGLAMIFAIATGMTTTGALAQRALAVLPLGPRELNRATWILSVLLPLTMLGIARCLAGVVDGLFADQWSWVYPASPVRVIYETLFLALVGAGAVSLPERYEPDFRADPRLYMKLLVFLAAAVVPFVAIPHLPATFSGITALGWSITVVLIAISLTPLIWTPTKRRQRDSMAMWTSAPPAPTASTPRAEPRGNRVDALHGLWRLLPGLLGVSSMWVAAMLAMLIVVQFNSPRATIWQPFDPAMTELRFLFTVCITLFFLVGLLPGLGSWLRRLRNLPLSRTEVAAILSLAPATTPLLYWLALVSIHTAVGGSLPDTLRLGYLFTFVGLASLVDAVGLRTGSVMARFVFGAALLMAFEFGSDRDQAIVNAALAQWVTPMTGVALLAAAFLINVATVTRSTASSRAYRFGRPTLPAGAR